jgi:hypothetical protein
MQISEACISESPAGQALDLLGSIDVITIVGVPVQVTLC